MKLLVTRLFPDAKVLVLLASLCFVLSCGKSQAVSGKSEADSNSNKSQPDNRNSDAPISDRDAVVGQKNADDKASPSASPTTFATPPAEKGPTYASRSVKDDEVVAMARRVRAAMPKDTDSQSLDLVSAERDHPVNILCGNDVPGGSQYMGTEYISLIKCFFNLIVC